MIARTIESRAAALGPAKLRAIDRHRPPVRPIPHGTMPRSTIATPAGRGGRDPLRLLLLAGVLLLACAPGERSPSAGNGEGTSLERFGFGRPATAAEIAALDLDVMPDGEGLPPGSGSVAEGQRVYREQCAACHGATGREGPQHKLVADPVPGFGFGDDPSLLDERVIGNYWPYATTVFDYVRRSMPHDRPGSLPDADVYAVTAWLLWQNGVIAQDAVLDATTLPAVLMPARDRFVADSATRR
ncbi:MAG: cytochrome c [Gemmatimonadetes bacterium]|nr:cytochrome c [Gemmatimonadota bacterium]